MDKPGKIIFVSRLLTARQMHVACSEFRRHGTTLENHPAIVMKKASETAGELVGRL